MPRGMDNTFHRLLWITLVVIAFTFTVILTSVFVDIDDLLAKRSSPVVKQQSVTESFRTELPEALVGDYQQLSSNEEESDENDSTFRTKRSLESNNYHIKSPKIKKILTNRLATLLEELDDEEPPQATNGMGVAADVKDKNVLNSKYVNTEEDVQKKEKVIIIKDAYSDNSRNEISQKDALHFAIHNIILQGIINHMDLNEVYKKVHLLIKNFDIKSDSEAKEIDEPTIKKNKSTELMRIISHDSYNEEDKFLNELIKCGRLQKEILQSQRRSADEKEVVENISPPCGDNVDRDDIIRQHKLTAGSPDTHMVIKTIIEITNNNGEKKNLKNSNENITADVKLVYNGKEIKPLENKNVETETIQNTHNEENQQNMESLTEKFNMERQGLNKSALDEAIAKYLKTHSTKYNNKYNVMAKGSFVASKRIKRQIKIRYLDDRVTTQKAKRLKGKSKQKDDELYVEIETHFDGKGTKGEKKKKLVRTLIDKIQKAINSNVDLLSQDKTIKQKDLQIKKRMQNPIDHNELTINATSPIEVIEHRELSPISKTANVIQPLTSVLDKSGDTWKKIYNGPGFLTVSKSLNSAEMRELDVDYNSVMRNGIPKRLQKPINTENKELLKPNESIDNTGNITLFLKDINGSGFSIGINQYTDEPPDKETLKMFTGLENLIQAYHEHYDQTGVISSESADQVEYIAERNHEIRRRDINRQINGQWRISPLHKGKNRHKRGAKKIKLFSNIKSKTKLNKFLNTNPMATKKIFLKGKRNKRQIDKIRIVASDRYPQSSNENIFLLSRENVYADRAIVKGEEIPEVEIGSRDEEHYDFIAPYLYNTPNLKPAYLPSIYNTKSLHTGLMTRYPHILLENMSRSKEEFINVNPINNYGIKTVEKQTHRQLNAQNVIATLNDDISTEKNISSTNVDEIVNAILPSRNNFKVVVKILPKNNTNAGPGYKEVHTSINKSYDKNGVRYVSSLNVSEVSKFESLNKTKIETTPTIDNNGDMELRQKQIKLLLELHKERIDQQLEHLKIESQNLKQMIGNENVNKNISHLINIFKQLGLKSLYGRNHLSLNVDTLNSQTTTIPNTYLPVSETSVKSLFANVNKQDDPDKEKILNSIKENENITRVILQKIDKNTDILQLLSKKLRDQPVSPHPQVVTNTTKIPSNDQLKYVVVNKIIDPFYEQIQRNITNPIPFIYAFQHPLIENKDKPIQSVTNVVYHGHIHANKNDGTKNDFLKKIANNLAIKNDVKIDNKEGSNVNETRFFIDDLENDFKMISDVNSRIPVKTNNSKT